MYMCMSAFASWVNAMKGKLVKWTVNLNSFLADDQMQ